MPQFQGAFGQFNVFGREVSNGIWLTTSYYNQRKIICHILKFILFVYYLLKVQLSSQSYKKKNNKMFPIQQDLEVLEGDPWAS